MKRSSPKKVSNLLSTGLVLALINCSRTKDRDGSTEYSERRVAEYTGDSSFDAIMKARHELAGLLGLPRGEDLGGETHVRGEVTFLPAWRRYRGGLFRTFSNSEWHRLLTNPLLRIGIVSGLYGFVLPVEPIRLYDIHINRRLDESSTAASFWRLKGLPDLIAGYANEQGVMRVFSFLEEDYDTVASRVRSESLKEKPYEDVSYVKFPPESAYEFLKGYVRS